MKRSLRRKYTKLFVYFLLSALSIIIAFPFVWLTITAFKSYPDIYAYPIKYLPTEATLEHFDKISSMQFGVYFRNSIIVGFGTMILSILIALFPAYAFSRYRFRGKGALLITVLFLQMFPQVVFLVPMFKFLGAVGWLDTYWGIIFSYLPFTTPISIVFLRSFFIGVPKSLEEAAMIDGCSRMKAFIKVIFPVTLPGIAAVGIYAFLFSWQELMYSMSILLSKDRQTVPVFLSLFIGQYQTRWGPLFAGSVLSTLPPLIIFMILQRYFISGLVSGAVKE